MKNLKINPKTLVVIDMIGTFTKKESSSIIYLSDDHNQSINFPRHCQTTVEDGELMKKIEKYNQPEQTQSLDLSIKKKMMHIPYIIGIA